MAEVIELAQRRERRARRRAPGGDELTSAEFLFDLACPFTYLAAERVERAFEAVVWTPVPAGALGRRPAGRDAADERRLRRAAEARARALRMPLVWPERFPRAVPAVMRVAAYAAECGRAAAFTLAAGRLAYCGGFDLEDPETIAEAAAASGLGLDACLAAARDASRDAAQIELGRRLAAAGADTLPALRVGRSLFWGEQRVAEAAAAARLHSAAAGGGYGLTRPARI